MEDSRRRLIAFIAGRMMGTPDAQAVFDLQASKHTCFSGEVSGSGIFLYDLDHRRRVIGQAHQDELMLAYGEDQIRLRLLGPEKTFEGFDAASESRFHGSVSGRSVSLFDDKEKKAFLFEL